METQKYFKKKTRDKIVCQVCGSKEFKTIAIMENEVRGKVIAIDFSLYCKNDHVCHFKEYIKQEPIQKLKRPKTPPSLQEWEDLILRDLINSSSSTLAPEDSVGDKK